MPLTHAKMPENASRITLEADLIVNARWDLEELRATVILKLNTHSNLRKRVKKKGDCVAVIMFDFE